MTHALVRLTSLPVTPRLLSYSLDEERVRSQDFFTVMASLATNHAARPLVWEFVQSQWITLVDK